MERSLRGRVPAQEGGGGALVGPSRDHQDLEPALDHSAAIRRPDVRGLQRTEAHPGAGHRGDGRPQVRRVRADADVLRPLGRPQGKARLRRGDAIMSKRARARSLGENEAKAVSRMLRISPQKLNLVATLIRGKKVAAALADLEFSRKRIARDVRKCLESAIANAENNHDLDVAEAHVGKALVLKRFTPRGRGRMGRIFKPFANLTIVVREVEVEA